MFCNIFIQTEREFRGQRLGFEPSPVKGHSANSVTDVLVLFCPEGEIQGTVHRRLLEEREEELKVGSVLLLKQVGLAASARSNLAVSMRTLKNVCPFALSADRWVFFLPPIETIT